MATETSDETGRPASLKPWWHSTILWINAHPWSSKIVLGAVVLVGGPLLRAMPEILRLALFSFFICLLTLGAVMSIVSICRRRLKFDGDLSFLIFLIVVCMPVVTLLCLVMVMEWGSYFNLL